MCSVGCVARGGVSGQELLCGQQTLSSGHRVRAQGQGHACRKRHSTQFLGAARVESWSTSILHSGSRSEAKAAGRPLPPLPATNGAPKGETSLIDTVKAEYNPEIATRPPPPGLRAKVSALFTVAAATLFGGTIFLAEGSTAASQFFAGYLLELSLSVDNLFVFVLIFDYFQVPATYQSKVLTYGIGGAVVFRAILIGAGLSAISAFESINLLFAAVLIFSSIKLLSEGDDEEEDLSNNGVVTFCRKLIPVSDSYEGSNFFTMDNGVKKATPLLLTLAVVELTDIFFAFDSIPAIFGVTQDPFIVFTSNIFAILGLRSLYTVIASSMADLRFLQPAIAAVLGFIGAKLLADFFGVEISTETSLFVVATLLGGGVFLSLRFPKEETGDSL